jgi:chromosome partitioning protein
MVARVIAVMNQKGGVGKTTTTANLAHALAQAGQRVLALDMDPQGQLAVGLGVHVNGHAGLDSVLLDGSPLADVLVDARDSLRLAPAGARLAEFEYVTEGGAERGMALCNALQQMGEGYDYVLVDAPPSTGLLAMNVIMAVDEVLVPVTGDFLGLHGVSRFMQILKHIDEALERETRVWIALTRFNERRRLARDVRDKLLEYFPGAVLTTAVRECSPLAECPGLGKTVFEYRSRAKGADDYRALAGDLMNRRTL